MRYIKLILILCAVLVLPGCSMEAGGRSSKSSEQKSGILRQLPAQVASRLQLDVSRLPAALRPDAEALVSAIDEAEKRSLIERMGDSASDSVRDLFVDLLDVEPLTSVRLDLMEYLIRNPRPNLAPVFDRLAKSDPNPEVAIKALEGVRTVEVLKLRGILTQRLQQANPGSDSWKTFAEADERWISVVRGTMLPAFMRVAPPVFAAKEQSAIRVVAFGDFGTGTDEQKQVASAMMAHHGQSPFDIGITVGDNFYPIGMESLKDPRWQTWWEDVYGPMNLTFYAVLGNHDWYHFDSPAAEILYSGKTPSWIMPAPYYTFTAGPVQFFALDTQEVSAKQLKWLDEQLQKSQSRWKVAFAHHPIFSDGYHGDNDTLKAQLFPVLKNRVDLYITGHEHDMQHLQAVDGVNFVISGGGGRSLRPPQPTGRALFAKEAHGFTILEANANELKVQLVGADSQVMHEFTLQKANRLTKNVPLNR
jgi:hypothetical protein